MNITMRKLALLEQSFKHQEEIARIEGYTSIPTNTELKQKVTDLMNKVRLI